MGSDVSSERYDRVVERRRAVALARHFRESEGLSIAEIAARLGRSPATVKAYFYDPTGEKARAVKARYAGVCRGCGAYTQPRNGKGDAYAYCKACHPGAIKPRWSREGVLSAMREWRDRYGQLPTSYDWSRTHARRRGEEAARRLGERIWPAASVVTHWLGTWADARIAAGPQATAADLTSVAEHRGLAAANLFIPNEVRNLSGGPVIVRTSVGGRFAGSGRRPLGVHQITSWAYSVLPAVLSVDRDMQDFRELA